MISAISSNLCIENLSIGFTALWGILRDHKHAHFPAIRCFAKKPHRGDNYFALFIILASQRRKQVIFNPQMYKNRRHPANIECRLSCCPILLSRCRFCSFLKLLSYRHTHIPALKAACETILTHF